jgi:hypothetical protein
LAFITFERYYVLKNSLDYSKRLSIRFVTLITALIWIASLLAATLPLFDLNNYSAYAICLPFDTRKTVYKFYLLSINSLLVSCFLFICTLYVLIFVNTIVLERRASLNGCHNLTQLRLRSVEDQKLARNITLLVMVNTICWGPVVFMCAYSLITMRPMKRSHLKLLAVFVMPFNSLVNPFLYCLSRRSLRMYIKVNFIKTSKFRRNHSASSSRSTTTTI